MLTLLLLMSPKLIIQLLIISDTHAGSKPLALYFLLHVFCANGCNTTVNE